MKNNFNICEMFSNTTQGEGKYKGYPSAFVRLANCTRKCKFCDSDYHDKNVKLIGIKKVIEFINNLNIDTIIVWTGGEPTLQYELIRKVIQKTKHYKHHLETNGDIIINYNIFDYVCFSPKDIETAKKIHTFCKNDKHKFSYDIKVVTNGKNLNNELIPYATMLMPLSVDYGKEKDKNIMNKVQLLCCKHNKILCLRDHIIIHGKKRGV